MWIAADFIHIRWISLWIAWGYEVYSLHSPLFRFAIWLVLCYNASTIHMWYCATEAIVVTSLARHRLHPT